VYIALDQELKFLSLEKMYTYISKSWWTSWIKPFCFWWFPFAYTIFSFWIHLIARIVLSRTWNQYWAFSYKYFYEKKITLRCCFRSHWVFRTFRLMLNMTVSLRARDTLIKLYKTLTFSLLEFWNFLLIFRFQWYNLFVIFYFFQINRLQCKIQGMECLFYFYWDYPMWFCYHIQYLF